jgi:hypothetical protein
MVKLPSSSHWDYGWITVTVHELSAAAASNCNSGALSQAGLSLVARGLVN